ncbi:hypothetical protein PV04_02396 [Phialophora macrospora]|uniref:C2H2-type domain-containing protein n=1 Tax=Phialophora macrospora TaxID=1851006 RepID=A0A0D2FU95_9EURO|nr:hypothetical protein PV04_02396 [Phialophora macrospora]
MPAAGLTISRSQWLEHQQTIHDLYVTQGLELKAIRQQLIDTRSFSASIPQYKRKLKEWKYVKNLKASVCRAIGGGLERRGLTHDTATTVVGGVVLSPDRLQRALRRHDIPTLGRKWSLERRSPTPDDVQIQRKPDSSTLSSSLASDSPEPACQKPGLSTARANGRPSPGSTTDHMRTEPLTRQHPSTIAAVVSRVQNGEAAHGDPGFSDALPSAGSSSPGARPEAGQTQLSCTNCDYRGRSRLELNQHRLGHEIRHTCAVWSCPRNEQGFVTINELERHLREVHGFVWGQRPPYKCFNVFCLGSSQVWYRQHSFMEHITEAHGAHCIPHLLQLSDRWSAQTAHRRLDTTFDDLDTTFDDLDTTNLNSRGSFQEIQSILEQGADVNAIGEHGSLFERAFLVRNCDLVCHLLERGARPEVPSDDKGRTCIRIAVDCGFTELVKLLIEHCARANVLLPGDFVDAFMFACHTRDVPLTQLLIEDGVILSAPLINGRTPLHYACRRGVVEIVKVLVDAGADINARSGIELLTPLQEVCRSGEIEIVKVLVEAGADVNAPPRLDFGLTNLETAAIFHYVDVARILLDAGADVTAPNPITGRSALDYAARGGHMDMLELLLDKCYHSKQFGSFRDICAEASKQAEEHYHSEMAQVLRNLAKGVFDSELLVSAGMGRSYWGLCFPPTVESHG